MKRSFIITLALLLCASSGWARGLGVLGLTGGAAVVTPSEIACTGSETFLRGLNASGGTESFEMGTGDTCASDWTVSNSIGIDTYSTGWSLFGDHSLEMTDDSSTSTGYIYAGGTSLTTEYYRFYVNVPDIPTGESFIIGGTGKYNTAIQQTVSLVDANDSQFFRLMAGVEKIPLPATGVYRVELKSDDTDGAGPGVATLTLRAFDADGDPLVTSNGGTDYELTGNSSYDSFRFFLLHPGNSSATQATVYVDGVKNCNDWCGAE